MRRAKIAVEAWNPDFGPSVHPAEIGPSGAEVDPGVEVAASKWRPLRPTRAARSPECIVFVDGVRRIDALVWITGQDGTTRVGLCASYAAGIVLARAKAEIGEMRVRRGLFTTAEIDPLETSIGAYAVETVAGETPEPLSVAIQKRLRELETKVAASAARSQELVIVDGPLSALHTTEATLGYVKTHRVGYLPERLLGTVHALEPGERTPLFLTETSWSRYSTYLRLPGVRTHAWAGIVRLEIPGETAVTKARALADAATSLLPRYASTPEKDPRAPQNLFPIGGLERELRRRLGDATLVHRALRVAAAK